MLMLIFVWVCLKSRVLTVVSLKVFALHVNERYVQVVRILTYKYFSFSKKLSSCKSENKYVCLQQRNGLLNVSMQLQRTKRIFKIFESDHCRFESQ